MILIMFFISCDDDGGSPENINIPVQWDTDLDGVLDNFSDFQNNGSITCIIFNHEEYIVGEGDMLAAFSNGEQRGVSIAQEVPSELSDYTYQFLLMMYGDVSNEQINFKYYKYDEDIIFDVLTAKEFIIDMADGTVINPVILEIEVNN